jgi:hypothetical protein
MWEFSITLSSGSPSSYLFTFALCLLHLLHLAFIRRYKYQVIVIIHYGVGKYSDSKFFRGISKIVRELVFVLISIEDVCAFMVSIHGMMHGEKHRDE